MLRKSDLHNSEQDPLVASKLKEAQVGRVFPQRSFLSPIRGDTLFGADSGLIVSLVLGCRARASGLGSTPHVGQGLCSSGTYPFDAYTHFFFHHGTL